MRFLARCKGELRACAAAPPDAQIDNSAKCCSVRAAANSLARGNHYDQTLAALFDGVSPPPYVDRRNRARKIDLIRHGQSTWNVENLFTGWHDRRPERPRTPRSGAGRTRITARKLEPQIAFTSVLKRAIRTLWLILDTTDRM